MLGVARTLRNRRDSLEDAKTSEPECPSNSLFSTAEVVLLDPSNCIVLALHLSLLECARQEQIRCCHILLQRDLFWNVFLSGSPIPRRLSGSSCVQARSVDLII